jgi:hypothetical protein
MQHEPLEPFRRRYLENLAALYAADPVLAAQLETVPFAALPQLEPTRDGNLTVRLTADNGKPIYAHSRYRPLEEAQTLVSQRLARPTVEEDDEAPGDLDSQCFLLNGLGLAYHVVELERRLRRPVLIVAEDDLKLIKTALCVSDIAKPLRDRRITILTSSDKAILHDRLRPIMTVLMLGLQIITLPHTTRYHVAFQSGIAARVRDFVQYSRLQMISVVRNARITCQNMAFNLSAYVGGPGVEALQGRAAGYPAILVAAGPSLARNIDQLAGLRDRAVIIAVQTVLKTLLVRGIYPHFVTSLDYHEISAQFFHGVEDFGDTVLVAEPKVTWHVIDAFRGPAHVLHNVFLDDLLRDAAPGRGKLRAGSTVAHLSFYLAEHLGCDPIILVGQDLSFSDGLYYPPGMQIERVWGPEFGRFQTVENKQWERIARCRQGARRVKDIHGRDVYADDQLFTYGEQFEADFLASPARVINSTEGGRLLAGCEVTPLRDAAGRFCARRLPDNLLRIDRPRSTGELRERVCNALSERLDELGEVKEVATAIHEVLEQLDDLVEKPAEFNRLVGRVDELRTRLRHNQRAYNLVTLVSQMAELRRLQADRAIDDTQRETTKTARRRLRRDREYVGEFIDGCDFLLDILPQALERVRERL